MTGITNSQDRAIIAAVVRLLLEGSELIAFKYDSGFTVTFQHDVKRTNQMQLPVEVSLVLRAKWWADTTEANPDGCSTQIEYGKTACERQNPHRAFMLMTFVGQPVESAVVADDGALTLSLSGGRIHVPGQDEEWDFSWYLFVPSEVPSVDIWSVNCDSQGDLEGTWPRSPLIPQTGSK